ncbi:MAG: hypothetical protein WBO55_05660 [Rhizobiaceae bacterium]
MTPFRIGFRIVACALLFAAFTLPASSPTMAGLPKGALGAIAVSPDGKTVAAAGDNRVLYLVDAATLEVKERIWIGYSPMSLFWTKDGKTLVMRHTDDVLLLFDTATWKVRGEIPAFRQMSMAVASEKVVTATQGEYNTDHYKTLIAIHDLNTGQKLKETELDREIVNIATNPDASQVVVIMREVDNESEAKAEPAEGLEGIEKETAMKKADGKTMDLIWFDGELKETAAATSWYSTYYTDGLHLWDGKTFVLAYGTSAEMSMDGNAELFSSDGVNTSYGFLFTPDHSHMYSGGLASGAVFDIASRTGINWESGERLPSWPEYFQGFGLAPDGTVFGGTSAYRLMRMTPDGKMELIKPIY